ncbi:MAG: oligopeptidase B, partial [Bacteroidetes bacterium]|nr:oligopeptidase B [Bacteroidota bacterium]
MNLINTAKEFAPPQPTKKDTVLTMHGDLRPDPYYWLRERNEPAVKAHLEAENSYLDGVMTHLKPFKESLFDEIKARIAPDDSSAPYFENGYYYYVRYEEGLEHPIYARKKGSLSADEEIMLNVNKLAKGYAYYQVNSLSVSPNNKWLAYGVDTLSRRIYTIYFKNLETGETLANSIKNTTGSTVWANDNQTVFFSRKDATLRPHQIWRQHFKQPETLSLVYEESDPTFVCYADKSKSDDYILIASSATKTTEYQTIPADTPNQEPTIFHKRERGLEYDIDHLNGTFYILTNWEAENFRLMKCSDSQTAKENWSEKITHRADVLLQDIELFDGGIAVSERINGICKIALYDWSDEPYYIDFQEDAYTAFIGVNEESDARIIRLKYTSMTTPMSSLDYHVDSGKLELVKEQKVMGAFSKGDYVSERLTIAARDGAKIPVSLVYHKDLDRNKPQPLLLYGYGSYGYSIDPYFS